MIQTRTALFLCGIVIVALLLLSQLELQPRNGETRQLTRTIADLQVRETFVSIASSNDGQQMINCMMIYTGKIEFVASGANARRIAHASARRVPGAAFGGQVAEFKGREQAKSGLSPWEH